MNKIISKKNIFMFVSIFIIFFSWGFFITNRPNEESNVGDTVDNATITVHHYIEGTTTMVQQDQTYNKTFAENYVTNPYSPEELVSPYTNKYFYNNHYVGDATSGIVGKASYEITYYYELREAEIITHYYIYGTEDKVQDSKIMYKKMNETYTTRALGTEELYSRYRNVYIYSNESAGDAVTGTVEKMKYIVTYYYVPRESTVTVHHYEINKDGNRTTNRVAPDNITPKHFSEEYVTSNLDSSELSGNYKNNYYYTGTYTGTIAGTVGTDNVEVTYYYEAKPSKITVHHYIEGTDTKVHADDVINKVYTDTYETRYFKTDELIGIYQNNYYYHNHHEGDGLTGTVNKDNYEIIYYYELRPSTITVHHYAKGTTTKVALDTEITDKKYTESYTITPLDPSELTGTYLNNYYYNGEHAGDALADIISKDNYEIIIYYEPRPSTIVVHHYLVGTSNKVHEDDVINKHFGDSYSTSDYGTTELDNPYKNLYCYNDTNGGDSVSGTVTKDSYDITYYYDYRPSTLTIHHYIEGTETKVYDDEIIPKKFNDTYEVAPHSTAELNDPYTNWYEYKSVKAGDQVSGTIIGESYEVTFYYDKIPATLIVHHYIKGTTTQIASDETFEMKLKDHYETTPKADGELNKLNYTYDSVDGEASGNINEVERVITYYYKLKPARLVVHYLADDTKESLCPDSITDVTYQDFYQVDSCTQLNNINYTYKEVITNDSNSEQRGTKMMGNILQDTVEVTYYYELKPGQIIVYYFEKGTRNRVADDVVSNGLASKEFISEAKEIEGYTLVSKPESNVHIYKENTQEVIYEYEKNTYRIGVEVIGGVGTITGSEEIQFGNDSTEGNIVITPSEGYEIEKILVDGEEIDIDDTTGMTLENFKKVGKDHKIEVEFTEVSIPVPITGISTKTVLIALIVIALSIVSFIYIRTVNLLKQR